MCVYRDWSITAPRPSDCTVASGGPLHPVWLTPVLGPCGHFFTQLKTPKLCARPLPPYTRSLLHPNLALTIHSGLPCHPPSTPCQHECLPSLAPLNGFLIELGRKKWRRERMEVGITITLIFALKMSLLLQWSQSWWSWWTSPSSHDRVTENGFTLTLNN